MRQVLGHAALIACCIGIAALLVMAVAGAFHRPRDPRDRLRPYEAAPGEDC